MVVTFDSFTLDVPARQLLRGREPVHLSPKALDLLALLVERRPAALSKSEIHERLWRGTFVSDVNLAVLVAEIRAALGEDARHPRFIRTVHRFGYAFSGSTREAERPRPAMPGALACWLAWGTERAPLGPGDHLLGRDPLASVRIDAISVSRRHALIKVAADGVTVQDLSSKNGTYIADVRVTAPVALIDGMEIRLGPVPIRFYQVGAATSTQTLTNPSRVRR